MATNTRAVNRLGDDDVELGQDGIQRNAKHNTNYVRDITYKVIPFCCVFLVVFSVGAILISTLAYEKPVPQQATIVVSSMLGAFFLLFCIGGIYLYHEKHYPPLTKGPNCPDRPEPSLRNARQTLKAMSRTVRRGTRLMRTTITKKPSSYTGTTTASRLIHHEQEVPDDLQERAISPDTFRAETLRHGDPWDGLGNHNDGRGRPSSPTRQYRESTRAGGAAQPEIIIHNDVPRYAYTRHAVSSQKTWSPAPRAPHLTRRPLPNGHLAQPHNPQYSSHLRHVNNSETMQRRTAVGLDPTLADQTHEPRQYPDLPPSASGNTMPPHPGTSVHDEPTGSHTPRAGPVRIYNMARGGGGETSQSPQSITARVMNSIQRLYVGVVEVPDGTSQLVAANPGLYLKLRDPDDIYHLCEKKNPSAPHCPEKRPKSASKGPECRTPQQPAPVYLGVTPRTSPRVCNPAPSASPRNRPTAVPASAPDPFVEQQPPCCAEHDPHPDPDPDRSRWHESAIPQPLTIRKTPRGDRRHPDNNALSSSSSSADEHEPPYSWAATTTIITTTNTSRPTPRGPRPPPPRSSSSSRSVQPPDGNALGIHHHRHHHRHHQHQHQHPCPAGAGGPSSSSHRWRRQQQRRNGTGARARTREEEEEGQGGGMGLGSAPAVVPSRSSSKGKCACV
ncbi:hypothetical protein F5X96DRAFT_556286 [Biscogniauxia mediterranea]|nr:hypothetical protein F5X96DRAFT_556286 [Biscogniauxia mediterranea]